MPDRPWKAEERRVARLLGGRRYPANGGGPVDVETPAILCQVKHVRTCSLARLEALAADIESVARQHNKAGLVVIKRRAGSGRATRRLVVMTETVWQNLTRDQSPQNDLSAGRASPGKDGARHEEAS